MLPLVLSLLALTDPTLPAPLQDAPRAPGTSWQVLRQEVELALSDETFWFSYRSSRDPDKGYFSVGFLANEDDDYLVTARLMRSGTHSRGRLEFGVGIAVYAATLDVPDADVFALALAGSARYALPTVYPTSVGLDLSVAPAITSFSDGEGLADLALRLEVELSPHARAFVGYRFLETELDRVSDRELDDSLHVGVRLVF